MLIVHRIVDVIENNDGVRRYQTWGDNREVSTVPDQITEDEYLYPEAFSSVYYSKDFQGTVIKGMGSFLDYLRSQQGFFLIVLLPMIIFFIYELVRVVINFGNYRKAKVDEDKQSAVDAAIAEALSDKNAEKSGVPDLTPEQMEQFKAFLAQQKQQEAEQEPEQETENEE